MADDIMPTIHRKEWLWALTWSIAILIITSLPYLYGAIISTPENQFSGFVIGVEDGNSYLAKMRLGATNGWRFHLFYTSEPHKDAYLLLFHLLMGKIARLSNLSFILVYHLARVICGFVLLLTVYYFTAFFTDLHPVRRLVFWLVGVGSGLGWLVVWLGLSERLGLPLDFYSPEAFIFHLLFGLPHLSLAEALLLWAMLFLLLAWEKQQWRYAWLAGLALLMMTTIAAFYIVVAVAVIGAGLLLRLWSGWPALGATFGSTLSPGESPGNKLSILPAGTRGPIFQNQWWFEFSLTALAFAIAAPAPLYNVYVFTTNPIFKVWAAQNRILSPAPFHYLLAFGLLVLLAVPGAWREWQRGSKRSLLLIGWCAVVPLLVYIPFNLQRRLTLGIQVALSILAALGLWHLCYTRNLPGKERETGAVNISRRWRVASIGLVTLLGLSNLLILAGTILTVSRLSPPIFNSGAQVNAANWLGAHATPDQVVLATYETGNYLPTRMPARVFAGHGPETVHSEAKRAMLDQFFFSGNDAFRRQLLQDYGVTYLFYGPAEQALGGFTPSDAPYLRQVYNNGPVQIYQVVHTGDG